ncbi:MAG: hypothetical protein IPF92_26605 [Myxococcales bacterium]|nr:hypothetical protein [Myxococcales bacterium]MBL0194167.1 hypothetical protein [Myxococcales bacterium]
MRVLRFQIRLPTGQIEQLNIESERVLIGSGAHCEIRLPLDQAAVEHLLIELGPAGVFAKALNFQPSPTINNVPFMQSPLPPDAVLGVNQTQIAVAIADSAGLGGQTQQKKKGQSPLAFIGLALMLPAAGYLFLAPDEATGPVLGKKEAPVLWGPPIAACPVSGAQGLARAQERMAIADAKRERRPFHVADGVHAVPLFEEAAACYRVGGDAVSAGIADQAARAMRAELNDDYRTQQVRLDHALSVEDWALAQRQVRILQQFTSGKTGEYVTWLSNLDRKLKLKIGEAAKKT